MGNIAIALIYSSVHVADAVQSKRQKQLEQKRVRSLIPRYLARLHDRDCSIATLSLNGLGVDAKILRRLSGPLLSEYTRVRELYLEHNRLGPEEATCIARILSRNTSLEHVSLAHNPVGCVGAMTIASALEQNNSLEKLDLCHCNVEDKGIQKLATSLKRNTVLKYLYLEGNPVSSVGIASLLRCVYDTASLRSLWESNHTVRAFHGPRSPYSPRFPETVANRRLVHQLGEVLITCNRRAVPRRARGAPGTAHRSIARTAARKILGHYLRQDQMLEYWECVESMEHKLMPHVLGWLVRHGDMHVIYGVVRDMPSMLEKHSGGKAVHGRRR